MKHKQSDMTDKPIRFFSFWRGRLPSIANLHFRSFLYFHPRSQYDLWADTDIGLTIPKDLTWITKHPQITINKFSLSKEVGLHIDLGLSNARISKLYNLLRSIHSKKIFRNINIKSQYDHNFKITYKHSSSLFTYEKDLTYRADLARCILPFANYDMPSFYSDVDVCFLSNLNKICKDRGLVYHWENLDFANNAIIYMPDKKIAKKILTQGSQIECFRPWYLFTKSFCEEIGLMIYPASRFDAVWSSDNLFFKNSVLSREIVKTLYSKNYILNHWHNNWNTVPESNSPYEILLKQFT